MDVPKKISRIVERNDVGFVQQGDDMILDMIVEIHEKVHATTRVKELR